MGDLSPIKILIVAVIALVVLGPEKLPDMTRRAGRAWSDVRRFRDSMHAQVQDVVGDVPGLDELRDFPALGPRWARSAQAVLTSSPPPQAGEEWPGSDAAPSGATAAGGDGPSVDDGTPPSAAWRPPPPPNRRPAATPDGEQLFAPDDPALN
ncbi:MAG TPA: twin-arginine translocase TatA/TatE family subunit [Acidimicrobiales bacterium]|jgi:sec-independent protein translocase protein TatB|nr:twin-arginine translocase TatA/TatE family subunit [Acidimicrobiales bacterium]